MKKNVTILISLVVLFSVLYAGNSFMKESDDKKLSGYEETESSVALKSFIGKVTRVYEGENVLEYGFDIPETATTTIDMNEARIAILDIESKNPLATVYMSYEGARGYTPLDYIKNIIVPAVSVIDIASTTSVGLYDWQVAESEGSEWRVASVASSSWLVIVESKKAGHDVAEKILESIFANQ